MTEPEPHIFVSSRRALRDRVGQSTADASVTPAAAHTRRASRTSPIAPRQQATPGVPWGAALPPVPFSPPADLRSTRRMARAFPDTPTAEAPWVPDAAGTPTPEAAVSTRTRIRQHSAGNPIPLRGPTRRPVAADPGETTTRAARAAARRAAAAPTVVETPAAQPTVVEPTVVEPPVVEPPAARPPAVKPPPVEPTPVEPPVVERSVEPLPPMRRTRTRRPVDESDASSATPLWDAITRRPSPAAAIPATPVWDAVARMPSVHAGEPAPPTSPIASPALRTPTPEIPLFVMPRRSIDPEAGAAGSRPAPPIFRAPPPALHLEPLVLTPATASAPVRHARHARRRTAAPLRLAAAAVTAAALVLGSSVAVTAAVTGTPMQELARNVVAAAATISAAPSVAPAATTTSAPPPIVAAPPSAAPTVTAAPAALDLCAVPAVVAALQAGDDAATIAALGGADAFRTAVATGAAPCVNLGDPARVWAVIDKQRPLDPIDFTPASLTVPDGLRSLEGGELRSDAASAMSSIVSAAEQAGAGEIAVLSAYRSYDTQVISYGNQVSDSGTEGAELVSARPGYSEHQSGLAADVVACDGGCGTLDDLGATAQGAWLSEHAWEFGWIVRYEDGHTGVTGYSPEPWHLRYVGVELAKAYHDGGWHTLEEFFGLPAAPDYAD